MTINSIVLNSNHPKSIITKLKLEKNLPFQEILTAESFSNKSQNLEFRERVYTPDITLLAFLSQVLENDQSLQKAVSRLCAFFISRGMECPSLNTAAYSKARSR